MFYYYFFVKLHVTRKLITAKIIAHGSEPFMPPPPDAIPIPEPIIAPATKPIKVFRRIYM